MIGYNIEIISMNNFHAYNATLLTQFEMCSTCFIRTIVSGTILLYTA